ncbi:transcriptional regulator, XRE family [Lachnospiraceae bacterium KM106-2]|nr:transcriptional regulator, XRE family [Lachnospiraceae bacterium KM106-2]
MEIGKQIRRFRTEGKFSQEELAERVFVSRQTISNWENDKSYPDVKSLVLLSSLFDVSLDTLIKGDLDEMKEVIKKEDLAGFHKESNIFVVLLICEIILPVPLLVFGGFVGAAIYGVIVLAALYYGARVEKLKKRFDIQTYREILTFMEEKNMDEKQKNQEYGKRPYQKFLLAVGCALITLIVAIIMGILLL